MVDKMLVSMNRMRFKNKSPLFPLHDIKTRKKYPYNYFAMTMYQSCVLETGTWRSNFLNYVYNTQSRKWHKHICDHG